MPISHEERIVPVAMAVILEGVPGRVGLGCIVGAAVVASGFACFRRVGGQDRAAPRKIQIDVAAQVDGEAQIGSRREEEHAPSRCGNGFDRSVDGRCVDSLTIAGRSVRPHVEGSLDRRRAGGFSESGSSDGSGRSRHGERRKFEQVPTACIHESRSAYHKASLERLPRFSIRI